MLQTSGSLSLIHEAEAEFLFLFRLLSPHGDGLEGDHAVDVRIASFVDHAHGSASQLRQDLVTAKLCWCWLFHGRPCQNAVLHTLPGRGFLLWYRRKCRDPTATLDCVITAVTKKNINQSRGLAGTGSFWA